MPDRVADGRFSAGDRHAAFDGLPSEPMEVQDINDAHVIREGNIFLLTGADGQVKRGNPHGHGLYYQDTRHLSGMEMMFSASKPLVLLSTSQAGFSSEQVLTNSAMLGYDGLRIPRATVNVRRLRVVCDNRLEETLTVRNHNPFPVRIGLVFRLAADFTDIFEVRGWEAERKAPLQEPRTETEKLTFTYDGLDGRLRSTHIRFSVKPDSIQSDIDAAFVTFAPGLGPQESFDLRTTISMDQENLPGSEGDARDQLARSYDEWLDGCTSLQSDNHFFNSVIDRSLRDLRMLWVRAEGGLEYPAAGSPWYDALFGRDAAITGLQTLAFRPSIARACLHALARHQGTRADPWRDEEPGKILHELRRGELTRTGELPFSPYFGSIDSTPLFLWLAAEYYRWTGDVETLHSLTPHISAAFDWIRDYGTLDGGEFVSYETRSRKGLVNQGWKDSVDAIVHEDGSLLEPPIALCEVQGYVYAALRGMADTFSSLGDDALARQLSEEAAALKQRYNQAFWLEDSSYYALAIGGDKRPSSALSSNPGQCLATGIIADEKAESVVRRLLSRDLFSGWGIRTLSTGSMRFNPQGYHVGTVWPHDNSIIALGLKKYGFEDELSVLGTALFEAATNFPYFRLPELFGGGAMSPNGPPVPYPVACRPQAWAAGAFLLITQALLGLYPDAAARKLKIVNPKLPHFLSEVTLRGIKVGPGEVDLLYRRKGNDTDVELLETRGELEVEVTANR